jgi:hypothetical protein
MATITIRELIRGAEELETTALEDYIQKILQIRAKRVANNLDSQEAELLKNINIGLSDKKRIRKAKLWKKREAETLSENEYQELMLIIDEAEALNVIRVINIGKLAQLRAITPIQLMEDLGIKPKKV